MEAASRPSKVLNLLKKEKPDLLLLDIETMPVMDGWEVLDKVRGMDGFSGLPVATLTPVGDFLEAQMTALKKKVQGVLQKPYHLPELLEIISIKEKGDADA